ncbi:MAG: hypothetical protein NT029_18675 [Armatimonadetes bacterium]|nr:hypothetical protein [Armatimonadota bacterium]
MRVDKSANLRDRLRKGADAFSFDALLQGVSTMEDDADASGPLASAPTQTPQTPLPWAALPAASPAPTSGEQWRAAMEGLAQGLMESAAQFAVAAEEGNVAGQGQALADANRVLELLSSVDPVGAVARSVGAPSAPPEGRRWPDPAWSVSALAASPLSALTGPGATIADLNAILQAAHAAR